MRELFIVGLKLYGVLSLVSGLSSAIGLVALWPGAEGGMAMMTPWVISSAIHFAVVYLAIAQAGRIADLFGLPAQDNARFSGFSARATLRTGLILIGAYQLMNAVPALLKELSSTVDPAGASSPQSNLFVFIQVAVPVALIWGSAKAVKFIEEHAAE